jgi:hypothetical protein
MAFGKKTELSEIVIKAPNYKELPITIVGTAPYVCNDLTPGGEAGLKGGMEGPKPDKPSKAKRPPKDFDGDYKGSMHTDVDHGWVGIPAAALRSAMIRACSTCGVEMTKAKQCFFVLADGIDRREKPLVKITKGKPERFDSVVKNSNGSTDVRARARFATGWECNLRIQYDADMFSETTVANLILRAGISVGVGAGRPFSSQSAGCGWGTFTIKNLKTKETAA